MFTVDEFIQPNLMIRLSNVLLTFIREKSQALDVSVYW